jgi:hypothetical protein
MLPLELRRAADKIEALANPSGVNHPAETASYIFSQLDAAANRLFGAHIQAHRVSRGTEEADPRRGPIGSLCIAVTPDKYMRPISRKRTACGTA